MEALTARASAAARYSRAPHSGKPRGAAVLLSDGKWVRGVRLESASYSLVVPAAVAATGAAIAAGRRDIVALSLSDAYQAWEHAFLTDVLTGPLRAAGTRTFAKQEPLPRPATRLRLSTPVPDDYSVELGIQMARGAAHKSLSPYSHYRVGCVLQTSNRRLVPGTNVEHPDWSRTLCAERCALVSAIGGGHMEVCSLFVSCLDDPMAAPCGACIQLLVEWAPDATVYLDRNSAAPFCVPVRALRPGMARHSGIPELHSAGH